MYFVIRACNISSIDQAYKFSFRFSILCTGGGSTGGVELPRKIFCFLYMKFEGTIRVLTVQKTK